MRVMSNRVAVLVPSRRLKAAASAVHALTKSCGGCTHTVGEGSYIGKDNLEHHETVSRFEWWYGGHLIREVESSVQDLIAALLTAGEECVMVIWLSNQRHEYAELHTLADMET